MSATVHPGSGSGEWTPAHSVKVMREGSDVDARPVFIVGAVGGTPSCWDEMLKGFEGIKRPIYGLVDPYLTGHDTALALEFTAWSNLIADAVQSKQSKGPYTLMGYSMGHMFSWSVMDRLVERGEQVDVLVGVDPNFPAWCRGDRLFYWDAPQMGIPVCVAKCVMPSLLPGFKMDWSTQAKCEKNVAVCLKMLEDNPENLALFLVHSMVDTGIVVHDTPGKYLKQCKKGTRVDAACKLMASAYEGVDEEYARKAFSVFIVTLNRIFPYTPKNIPKTTRHILIQCDRSELGKPFTPNMARVTQAFDRFDPDGKIEEMTFPKMSKKPPKGHMAEKYLQLQGSKAWGFEHHFRCLHESGNWAFMKTRVFEPLEVI